MLVSAAGLGVDEERDPEEALRPVEVVRGGLGAVNERCNAV